MAIIFLCFLVIYISLVCISVDKTGPLCDLMGYQMFTNMLKLSLAPFTLYWRNLKTGLTPKVNQKLKFSVYTTPEKFEFAFFVFE